MLSLLLTVSALAAPLQFVSVLADGNNQLKVDTVLTSEAWYPISQGMAQPSLVYTLDGKVLATRAISAQVQSVKLASTPTYNDSQLTVTLRDPSGVYDSISVGSWNGTSLVVRVLGPTRPSATPAPRTTTSTTTTSTTTTSSTQTRSSQATSSSSSRPSRSSSSSVSSSANMQVDVQPEDIVNLTVDLMGAVAQQQQAAQAESPGSTGSLGPSGPPPLDPNNPVVQACAAIDRNEAGRCYATFYNRPDAVGELTACSAFSNAGLREECLEHMEKSALSVRAIAETCQQVFGTDTPGMRCMNVAVVAETPPVPDILACGEGLTDERDRLGCMKRFSRVQWSPSDVLPVCKAAYPDLVVDCLAHIAGPFDAKPGLAQACVDGLSGELGLDCMAALRRREGDPVPLVHACTEVFDSEKERFKCVEYARDREVTVERIEGCAAEKKALKCVRP